VGDGTTSVTLLTGEFLKQVKQFVEEGVHPQIIVKSYRKAANLAIKRIKELAVHVKKNDAGEMRQLLERCAATALSSKLIATQKEFFAKMVVDAVMMLDELLPLDMIGLRYKFSYSNVISIDTRNGLLTRDSNGWFGTLKEKFKYIISAIRT
ncbi:predicted protein, partial [Nematostella vectensis]